MNKKEVCKECGKQITNKLERFYTIKGIRREIFCLTCFMIAVENGTNKEYFHWCAKCRRNRMVKVEEDSSKISIACTKCGHAIIKIPLFGNVSLKG